VRRCSTGSDCRVEIEITFDVKGRIPPAFFHSSLLRAWLPARFASLASAAAGSGASAASSSTTTKAGALGPWSCFVNIDVTTVQLNSVETLDRFGRRVALHLNECEASRTTGVPISHYGSRLHLANLRKEIAELILRRLIRQISDKYSR
jgi:hypothetical protein